MEFKVNSDNTSPIMNSTTHTYNESTSSQETMVNAEYEDFPPDRKVYPSVTFAEIGEKYKTQEKASCSYPTYYNNEREPYLVDWDSAYDQENSRNMSIVHKYLLCLLLTSCAFQVTSLNTAWNQTISSISVDLHTSRTVAKLGVTLFVFGLGIGPLFFSPISEFHGRRPVYMTAMLMYCSSQLLTVLGETMPLILVGRLLAGLGGGVFLTVVAGTFSDLFDKRDMSIPTLLFSIGPFIGPGVGPLLGGWINESWGYRWVFKTMLFWSFSLLVLVGVVVPETYEPILLKKKAKMLRKRHSDAGFYAPIERSNNGGILSTVILSPKRPLMMLMLDPVIFITSLYSGILLTIIYLFLVSYPIVFKEIYHFDALTTSRTFMGITVGMILTAFTYPIWEHIYYKLIVRYEGEEHPEFHLPQMMAGSIIVPIGLTIFAATIKPNIHFMVPIVASAVFGFGCLLVFNSIFLYILDVYKDYAASVAACNVFLRCIMAGVFPLFGLKLFRRLGFSNACFLLAGITLLLAPSPIIFFKYGRWLRQKSRFTAESES